MEHVRAIAERGLGRTPDPKGWEANLLATLEMAERTEGWLRGMRISSFGRASAALLHELLRCGNA